jgi:capsular exopolysaccharide synthesis family protein
MSRIFEALQRSEAERSGTPFEANALATDLLLAAEREAATVDAAPAQAAIPLGQPLEAQTIAPLVSPDTRLISMTDQESLAAEKFRFLSVRLRQMQQTRKLHRVLITSTLPEEGKSLVAANLAATLARRRQQKVLLLEGDLRRPVLARQFGHPSLPGITEWLYAPSASINNNIYYLEGPGFWFLPAGHPPENPLELMQTGRLGSLLEQLTASFEWIIIDSPPLLPLADTSVWTRLADGILLVVREGKTEKRQLQRGLEALDRSRLLGVVMNSCSSTGNKNYYLHYGPGAASSEEPRK